MTNNTLSERDSVTINIMKAIAILSVIAAHVVSISNINLFSKIVSSIWGLFAGVGVIIFFTLGGFLYNRKPGDNASFWKKKFFRIIIPWLVCSLITYLVSVILTHNFSMVSYFKWIIGSGTWYYYITIYLLFIFIFKWFYDKDVILWILIGLQIISLILITFNISTTIHINLFTDYLNPLHWIGYFSFGILARKYRLDEKIRQQKFIIILSYVLAIICACFLSIKEIYTYFHILSSLFYISSLVIIADISYRISSTRIARRIEKIGTWSYCIYLLHMQIVRGSLSLLPDGIFKIIFSPFIGLTIMVVIILLGLLICKKLPYGNKIKMIVGL